jgi:hypothetical protein
MPALATKFFLRAREGEFPKPTEARPGIPRELEEICMKAMQKNARDRYATAQEMALDLENYLSDAPISVHRDQWWEKLFRWSRHHRNLTRAVATFVVVLSFLLGLFLIHNSNVAAHERMMRSNSLRVAGAFAAKGLDQEIRNRWLILDRAASDAELIRLLQKLQTTAEVRMVDGKPNLWSEAAKPVYAELHRWLEDHHEQTKLKTNASNWYLFDSKGFLIGRYPRGDADKYSKNLGANFAYRSHFHGKEQDLTDEAEAFQTASPAEKPFLSSAFDSKSDSQVKVAFSVPVRIPETNEVGKEKSKPIAVLGMNVEPGQFAFLDLNKVVDNMDVVLVDTKIANLNKDKPHPYLAPDFRGLILHHSRWKDSKDGKRFGFSEQYVRDRFEKLIFADETEVPLTPIPDHVDPTDEQPDVSRMAIYAPVPLHGDNPRDGHGLIVIIQERVANTRKPVASDSAK